MRLSDLLASAGGTAPGGADTVVVTGTRNGQPYRLEVGRYLRVVARPEPENAVLEIVQAIYDKPVLQALRLHCAAYVHGHRVGGTNPSLVEALGAGNAIVAHDNHRWVVGEGGQFFGGADDLVAVFDTLLAEPTTLAAMREASRPRFQAAFTWPAILRDFELLLEREGARSI
jgi:glycosyltransferase involved in cell wall biosynthesis